MSENRDPIQVNVQHNSGCYALVTGSFRLIMFILFISLGHCAYQRITAPEESTNPTGAESSREKTSRKSSTGGDSSEMGVIEAAAALSKGWNVPATGNEPAEAQAADSAAATADAAATSASGVAIEQDDQYCSNMYRNMTPAGTSLAELDHYEARCPGYGLPIQWEDGGSESDAGIHPSFDCKKASTAAEHLICSDQAVATLDSELASAYAQARTRTDSKKLLQDSQKAWRRDQRDRCSDTACMISAYQERIEELRRPQ